MTTITIHASGDGHAYRVRGEREHVDAAIAELGSDVLRIEYTDDGAKVFGCCNAGGRIRESLSAYNRRIGNAGPTSQPTQTARKKRRLMDYYQARRSGLSCGKAFRAREHHPSTHGIAPDLVGEWVCYVYE